MGAKPEQHAWGLAVLALLILSSLPTVAASDPEAPSPPQDLTVVPNGDGTITLLWLEPANAATAGVDYYTVERLTAVGWALLDETTETAFLDDSVDPTSTIVIVYRVTARNPFGAGEATTAAAASDAPVRTASCYIVEWRGGLEYGLDGECAINTATEPTPEPTRSDVRDELIPAWAEAEDALGGGSAQAARA